MLVNSLCKNTILLIDYQNKLYANIIYLGKESEYSYEYNSE